jgi:hypothetical protein
MQTIYLNTEEASNKSWAAQDARQRNLNNKSHYSYQVQTQVERMKMVLSVLYSARNIFEAYGKKGVSIKLDHAFVKNRKELALIEADWADQGVTKRVSQQGIIYRLAA